MTGFLVPHLSVMPRDSLQEQLVNQSLLRACPVKTMTENSCIYIENGCIISSVTGRLKLVT